MVKLPVVIALVSLSFVSCAQSKSVADLQKKYKDESAFTLKFNDALQIIAVSSNAKHYSARDIKKLKKEISKQDYEELMSIKNGKGELQVRVIEKKGKPTKFVLIADNESEGFIALDFTASMEN
jgi:hypothetical protein